MGLGSHSEPVQVNILGEETNLPDSMQFYLEYLEHLLMSKKKGAWYISRSFRGEDLDATHLNVFTHAECEIKGSFEDVIKMAEQYFRHLCKKSEILTRTPNTAHLDWVSTKQKQFQRVNL